MQLFLFLVVIFYTLTFSSIAKENTATPDPVLIPLADYSSQRVLSKATGQIIEKMGYEVAYRELPIKDLWGALRRGLVHFQIEVWETSMSKQFNQLLAENVIEDLGQHDALVIEEWWYPNYVTSSCNGLPDWRALNNCASLFAQSEEPDGKGVYIAGPTNHNAGELIRGLSLNFKIHRVDNGPDLRKELINALAQQKPIVIHNWSPNWTDVRADGSFVKFPAFEPECETDMSWGLNPHVVNDCANRPNGWLKKAGWKGLKSKWPCVHQLISNMNFSQEMIAEASALVVYDGYSEEEAVKRWSQKYTDEIEQWQNIQCNSGN